VLALTAAFALPLAGTGGPSGSAEAYAAGAEPQRGDIVYFGSYPQGRSAEQSEGEGRIFIDNLGTWFDIEPIAWRVLQNDRGKLFLLSEKNLDAKPYHSDHEPVTWERSTIRSWLNGYGASDNSGDISPANSGDDAGIDYSGDSFIGNAFNVAESDAIATTRVENHDNPDHGTSGGAVTNDKMFLLSIEEATSAVYGFTEDYNPTDKRIAYNAAYVGFLLGHPPVDLTSEEYWWLRSPGDYSTNYKSSSVHVNGQIESDRYFVINEVAVRPALYLNPDTCFFEYKSGNAYAATPITIPMITTSALPGGKAGAAYRQKISATVDAKAATRWSVASGSLPPGLTLAQDGTISGTPGVAGRFTFTIRAGNDRGSDSKTFSIVIAPQLESLAVPHDKIPAATAPTAPGSKAQLPAIITFPDGTSAGVTWQSGAVGDTGSATVDSSGALVGISEGTVTLVATSQTDPTKKITIKITIAKNVTKVRTPLTKIYLKKGKALTPPVCADSVNVTTRKAETTAKLKWSSAKPGVASVNQTTGRITPRKTGKTTITATSLNGKAKLKITVYVVKKSTSLKKVTLKNPPKSMKAGKTAILKVSAAPAKATNLKVTFKSSKTRVIKVDKAGKLTALKKGKAKITVKIGKRKYVRTVIVK
jgi:uncharacterized protein YjdB